MNLKKQKIFLVSFLIILLVGTIFLVNFRLNRKSKTIDDVYSGNTKWGISFPPVQNQEQIDFSITHMKELGAELVRMDVTWKNREPVKGEYYWEPMDRRIDSFNENDISVLITIFSDGPEWACSDVRNQKSCIFNDEEDFRNFVKEFVKRYSNKIDKIQFGNEWDNVWGFVGTEEQFTEYANIVYEETKKYSPKTEVVLGGLTKTVPLYLVVCEVGDSTLKYPIYSNAGEKIITKEEAKEYCSSDNKNRVNYVLENANYDLIDLHLYDQVENFEEYYNALKNKVNVPVIVTELGVQEGFSPLYKTEIKSHGEQVLEVLQKMDSLNVPEVYYFNLVDGADGPHTKSGLIYQSLKEKPAYFEFKEFSS